MKEKEITKKTELEEVRKAPLRIFQNPDLKIRKGGWYYDNRGAVWKVILLHNEAGAVCGRCKPDRKGFLDTGFSTWHISQTADRGWVFTSSWYLVDEVEKTPGFDKLKAEWLKDPAWNEEILNTFSCWTGWDKKDWAPCYYLGPKQLCLPHHAKKLKAKRGKNDK